MKQRLESPRRAERRVLRSDDCIYESCRYALGIYRSARWMVYIFLKDIKEYIFSPYMVLAKKTNVYAFANSRQTI